MMRMKPAFQRMVSVTAYHAIWEWMDMFPMEFANLYIRRQPPRGDPDKLFMHLYGGSRKNLALWPFLTALILLCPNMLSESLQLSNPMASLRTQKAIVSTPHPSMLSWIIVVTQIPFLVRISLHIKGEESTIGRWAFGYWHCMHT